MNTGEPVRFSASCWTPGRRNLCKWLEDVAPPLAQLYESAVHLMFVERLPARLRLVAHAVREIRNSLPDYIAPLKAAQVPGRVDDNHLSNLCDRWERDSLPLDGSLPEPVFAEGQSQGDKAVRISRGLFLHVSKIVRRHRARRGIKNEAAGRLFRSIAPENESLGDAVRPVVVHWEVVTDWFMRHTHDPRERLEEPTEEQLIGQFEEFEQSLIAIVGPIVQTLGAIRDLVEEANS